MPAAKQLAIVLGAVFLVVVVLVAVALSGGEDDTQTANGLDGEEAFVELLAAAYPVVTPYAGGFSYEASYAIAELDGIAYYVTTTDEAATCLVMEAQEPRMTYVANCASDSLFLTNGISAGLQLGERRVEAFLLPGGYAQAASALAWAELHGSNLLIVSEGERPPGGRLELAADEPGREALELSLTGPVGSGGSR